MGVKTHKRHSARITRTRRWKALRLIALRRDGFRCVECRAPGRLDVDHIKPVREAPELAFELSNLQSLCAACHGRKTAAEVGLAPIDPRKLAWRNAVKALQNPSTERETKCSLQ